MDLRHPVPFVAKRSRFVFGSACFTALQMRDGGPARFDPGILEFRLHSIPAYPQAEEPSFGHSPSCEDKSVRDFVFQNSCRLQLLALPGRPTCGKSAGRVGAVRSKPSFHSMAVRVMPW